ncbi:hypothetical protein F4X86_03370 [Candidatus Saccharibacteria bacterium]|nr:hypothetical protein [Candidatus Saccharibacteria bacterium]
MIFINLLPDIKLEYARALRIKRLLVLMSAVLITCCIIVVSALFFYAEIQQPRQIARIEGTPTGATDPETGEPIYSPADSNNAILTEIKRNREISRILTIQNQLNTLPGLREDRTAVDRLFRSANGDVDDLAYLESLIPEKSRFTGEAPVEMATFDFEANTFTLSGKTDDSQSALELEGTIEYIGVKDDCETENIFTRIYPFRLDSDIDIPPGSTPTGENDEPERISYQLSGIFSADLFDPAVKEDELKLVVPAFNVGNDNIPQPDAKCSLPESNDQRLNPVSGNAAPASEDAAAPDGNQEDGE